MSETILKIMKMMSIRLSLDEQREIDFGLKPVKMKSLKDKKKKRKNNSLISGFSRSKNPTRYEMFLPVKMLKTSFL